MSAGPQGSALVGYALALLGIVVGVAAVVAGESDDSPGLQLLGALLVLGTVVATVRSARRRRQHPRT